jgi:predicted ATPase/DNA-binding CsgD family transcriptional regulator
METAGSADQSSVPPTPSPGSPGRLPLPLTSFLARDQERREVSTLLRREDVRLLTLTGPGGVGKTRLAIAVANEVALEVADGSTFVDLAPVRDPALVVPAIAQALGICESSDRSMHAGLVTALQSAELLLVLDNFEHVLAAGPLVVELLTGCPRITILTTSRAALHVSGEREYPVPPLSLPDPDLMTPRHVADAPAVRLFVERAMAVDPSFTLTDDNAAAIAAICVRLDGLPLAIELAAARSKVLPPSVLLPRLARQLPLLTGGPRDVPARLQTMHEAIAWSHDLLTPDEQAVFRRLAVFSGGFDLASAEIVCHGIEARLQHQDASLVSDAERSADADLLPWVTSLVDKSLLQRSDAQGSGRRLGMLETVREFATDQLVASTEEIAARAAHADCYVSLAERAESGLYGPEQRWWNAHLEAELPNLRAAMSWLRDSGHNEQGLRMATALGWFWHRRNHNHEGHQWLSSFLAGPQSDSALHARALSMAAVLEVWLGQHATAWEHSAQSLAQWRKLGDRAGTAVALRDLGGVMMGMGDYDRAGELLAESLGLFGDPDIPWDTALLLEWLGVLSYARADYAVAIDYFTRAQALFEQVGDVAFANWMRGNIGWVAVISHDDALARSALAESLDVAWELGDSWWVSWCLMGAGGLATRQGEHEQAARLFGVAETMRGATRSSLLPSVQMKYDTLTRPCRTALGEERWTTAFEIGARRSLAEAVDEGRRVLGPTSMPTRSTATTGLASGLTRREVEVLGLLVGGRSDREIAAALFIGHRNAQDHVSNVIAKLGVANRTEAAAVAVRDCLV